MGDKKNLAAIRLILDEDYDGALAVVHKLARDAKKKRDAEALAAFGEKWERQYALEY